MRRALIASDSRIASDPRVLKQVGWLTAEGFEVDTLGRGPRPDSITGTHFEMPRRPLVARLLAYALLPNALRHRALVDSTIPGAVRAGVPGHRYELAVLNEIELLPWFTGHADALMASPASRTHLDLHEYSPSQSRGLVFQLLFARYRRWLTSFIPSPVFDSRSVVAKGIGELYSELFGIPEPHVVRNSPPYAELSPSRVDPDDIRLVHHGVASAARRVDLIIDAMAELDARFSLHLMLVGNARYIAELKKRAAPYGTRVVFHEGVPIGQVAAALRAFDLEVIFYPPVSENLRLALPNKFFEAVQGRLGLVIGDSPEMRRLVDRYGNGAVIEGWTVSELARGINALTADQVTSMKDASHSAAPALSAESEHAAFLGSTGLNDD